MKIIFTDLNPESILIRCCYLCEMVKGDVENMFSSLPLCLLLILSSLRTEIMLWNFCISCGSRIISFIILSKSLRSSTEYEMTEYSVKQHLFLPPQATMHIKDFIGFLYTQYLQPTGDAFYGEEPCQRDVPLLTSSFQMLLPWSRSWIMRAREVIAITEMTCHTWNSTLFCHYTLSHS